MAYQVLVIILLNLLEQDKLCYVNTFLYREDRVSLALIIC